MKPGIHRPILSDWPSMLFLSLVLIYKVSGFAGAVVGTSAALIMRRLIFSGGHFHRRTGVFDFAGTARELFKKTDCMFHCRLLAGLPDDRINEGYGMVRPWPGTGILFGLF